MLIGEIQFCVITRSRSPFLCPHSDACLPDFQNNYQLGDVIGEGAFSKVKLATVKVDGPYRDMQVAVKCVERHNLRREDEENLLEEVRAVARSQRGAWLPGRTNTVDEVRLLDSLSMSSKGFTRDMRFGPTSNSLAEHAAALSGCNSWCQLEAEAVRIWWALAVHDFAPLEELLCFKSHPFLILDHCALGIPHERVHVV